MQSSGASVRKTSRSQHLMNELVHCIYSFAIFFPRAKIFLHSHSPLCFFFFSQSNLLPMNRFVHILRFSNPFCPVVQSSRLYRTKAAARAPDTRKQLVSILFPSNSSAKNLRFLTKTTPVGREAQFADGKSEAKCLRRLRRLLQKHGSI